MESLYGTTIVAASISSTNITLFTDKGEIISVAQPSDKGDYIIDQIGPLVKQNKPVTLSEPRIIRHDRYTLLSKLTNGLLKFKEIFTGSDAKHYTVSLDNVEIPNINKIDNYIDLAVETKETSGLINLTKRLTAMISERDHSVQDVLDFLSKSDLPLTSSGDIIAYRSVKKHPTGGYRDFYSGLVYQDKGYEVSMNPELLDKDRKHLCSTGLHVASMEYALGFYSHNADRAMLLILVRPEDIITVPHNDPTKIRVSKYSVLGVLSESALEELQTTKKLNASKCVEFRYALKGVYTPIKFKTFVDRNESGDTIATVVPVKNVVEPETTEGINEPSVIENARAKTSKEGITNQKLTPSEARAKAMPSRKKHYLNPHVKYPDITTRSPIWLAVLETINSTATYTSIANKHGVSRSQLMRWLKKYTIKDN